MTEEISQQDTHAATINRTGPPISVQTLLAMVTRSRKRVKARLIILQKIVTASQRVQQIGKDQIVAKEAIVNVLQTITSIQKITRSKTMLQSLISCGVSSHQQFGLTDKHLQQNRNARTLTSCGSISLSKQAIRLI